MKDVKIFEVGTKPNKAHYNPESQSMNSMFKKV